MSKQRIIRLDIVDNEPEKQGKEILATYYLIEPNEDKLNALKELIEKRNSGDEVSEIGIWDIDTFVAKNFILLDVERTVIKW